MLNGSNTADRASNINQLIVIIANMQEFIILPVCFRFLFRAFVSSYLSLLHMT